MRSAKSFAVSSPSGSTTARLPWTHLGSIGLSQGLLVGKKHGRIRTPLPSALTWALCSRIQVRTSLLTCQEARACVSRSEEHTSELQSHSDLVCRLLLE